MYLIHRKTLLQETNKQKNRAGDVVQGYSACLACSRPWVQSPMLMEEKRFEKCKLKEKSDIFNFSLKDSHFLFQSLQTGAEGETQTVEQLFSKCEAEFKSSTTKKQKQKVYNKATVIKTV
jgi:hypothetical protein